MSLHIFENFQIPIFEIKCQLLSSKAIYEISNLKATASLMYYLMVFLAKPMIDI